MADFLDQAAELGAPELVRSMAQLFDLPSRSVATGVPDEAGAAVRFYLNLAEFAASVTGQPLELLPEFAEYLRLAKAMEAGLPAKAASRVVGSVVQTMPPVEVTLEAMTPLITAECCFADAVAIGDDRALWATGAPQMTIEAPPPLLPSLGALWRGRLTKTTDLLLPITSSLKTRETIEITAEGDDSGDGYGFRRYSHVLVGSDRDPSLMQLRDDHGWIELSGTPRTVQVRLYKKVTVLVPAELHAEFGALLPVGLHCMLWMWGQGFLKASAKRNVPVQEPVEQTRATPEMKSLPSGAKIRVAVAGGGPAGLACAWLLSNPKLGEDRYAWKAPDGNPSLQVHVDLFEAKTLLGGKAASHRESNADQRIVEHGLHVLMGCYKNLLGILDTLGDSKRLTSVRSTRMSMDKGGSLDNSIELRMGQWPAGGATQPLAALMNGIPPEGFHGFLDPLLLVELRSLWSEAWNEDERMSPGRRTIKALGLAVQHPRPLLRVVLRLWDHLERLFPTPDESMGHADIQPLGMKRLLGEMALVEIGAAAFRAQSVQVASNNDPLAAPDLIQRLAAQLRVLARDALSLRDPRPEVRLVAELIELGSSVVIGLAAVSVFPNWVIGRPDSPLGGDYDAWARTVQALDTTSLGDWLDAQGIAEGFVESSRVLDVVAAGLFTTPDRIAAGTFIHGLTRLFFTYVDSPYLMMPGGTGESVIDPIHASLESSGRFDVAYDAKLVAVRSNDAKTATHIEVVSNAGALTTHEVDALVIALPPFDNAFDGLGLPKDRVERLGAIRSRATLSIQRWTTGPACYAEQIVSGLPDPFRCCAAMTHLQGAEGANVTQAPVYYCGDIDEDERVRWTGSAGNAAARGWITSQGERFQKGPEPNGLDFHFQANLVGSERYTWADVATQKARPYVYETGMPNVWFAGDWTRSTLACGSIEAAVTSGLEAARHLLQQLGCTVNYPIVGPIF